MKSQRGTYCKVHVGQSALELRDEESREGASSEIRESREKNFPEPDHKMSRSKDELYLIRVRTSPVIKPCEGRFIP